jgi:glucose-6-phosphate isomerase
MSLTLDFTNCLAEAIGATHGLTKSEVDTLVAKFPKHHENVDELRSTGESGFFDLPYQDTTDLKALIKKHQGQWDNLVIIGMGGSVLSPQTLFKALTHSQHNVVDAKVRGKAPRVFFLSNPDPKAAHEMFEILDIKKTMFQIVSRSGVTPETMCMTLWLLETLKKKVGKTAPAEQVIITTEPTKSPLMEIAKQEKIATLPTALNLTGRYGILGNQSLFMAGMCNLKIDELLKGGADMDKRCRHGDPHKNPAYMHSLVHYLLTRKRRKTMHVTFSFSNRVHAVGEWYNHQCSVSLGKMLNRKGKAVHVGPSPVAALGAYDGQGQQQLFCEGPFDKVITFITVKDHGAQAPIPPGFPKLEAAAYLKDTSFTQLLDYSYWGAEQHVTQAGRPNMTIQMDTVDEAHIGGLVYLLQLSTAMSAELYGIDPFDQPGVEHGKAASMAQLGRAGFEDLAKRLKDYKAKPRRTC